MANSAGDYAAFAELVREYWGWLAARYQSQPGFIDRVASHQGMEEELGSLPAIYGPPQGKTLLARSDGEVCGGIAYRDLHDGSCEMKRLFVPERAQGRGVGRRLCRALISTATNDGFGLMRLDTGSLNLEAARMYESMGFRRCPPYREYPPEILPHLLFMEMPLSPEGQGD